MRLRSAYDREILRLALPALGALAAEPLYILVDTAIVGHLGRSQLAALGAAATVLSVLAMFNFLQYGTTAQVARASGAGRDRSPGGSARRRSGCRSAIGIALAVAIALLAEPIVALVGVEGETADYAATYLRIVSIGIPSFFLALGGQGYLRGVSELHVAARRDRARQRPQRRARGAVRLRLRLGDRGARPGGRRSRRRAWGSRSCG